MNMEPGAPNDDIVTYIRTEIEGSLGVTHEVHFEDVVEYDGQVEIHYSSGSYAIAICYHDGNVNGTVLTETFAYMYHSPDFSRDIVSDSAYTLDDLIEKMVKKFGEDTMFQNRFHPMFPDHEAHEELEDLVERMEAMD